MLRQRRQRHRFMLRMRQCNVNAVDLRTGQTGLIVVGNPCARHRRGRRFPLGWGLRSNPCNLGFFNLDAVMNESLRDPAIT